MYKKIVAVFLISIFYVSPAFAGANIVSLFINDLAAGLGSAFGIKHSNKEKDYTEQWQQLRANTQNNVKREAKYLAKRVEAEGYESVSRAIMNLPEIQGEWKVKSRTEHGGRRTAFSSTHKSNGWLNIHLIDSEEQIVMVVAQNANLYITERAVVPYKIKYRDHPPKQIQMEAKTDTISNEKFDKLAATIKKESVTTKQESTKNDIFASTGFDIANVGRSKDGCLIVSKVKLGSIVSNSGMLEGTDLLQVDNMNTKQCTAEEIRSYIAKQAETNSTIAVYFIDENLKSKRVDVRLQ